MPEDPDLVEARAAGFAPKIDILQNRLERLFQRGAAEDRAREKVVLDVGGRELVLTRTQCDLIETAYGNWQGDDEASVAEMVLTVIDEFGLLKFPNE